jgi:hypothetical protein
LAPRYPAAQVEAQLEEIQQEDGDYPIQLQPEMVEPEHQEVQPRRILRKIQRRLFLRMMRQRNNHSCMMGFFWRLMRTGI